MYITLADFEQNIDEYMELAETQTIYIMNENGKVLFLTNPALKGEPLHEKG